MSLKPTTTKAKRQPVLTEATNDSDRKVRFTLRRIGYALLLVLAVFAAYRAIGRSRRSQIELLGGVVSSGPPPIYYDLANAARTPPLIRSALSSKIGSWLFSQVSHVYGMDLRGIRDPNHITEALQVAQGFDCLTDLTLYQSGVTDDHLLMVSHFRSLERLKINETAITDVGIHHLRNHPSLQLVNAQRTAITDASVHDLASIRNLKELNIAETGITSVEMIRGRYSSCRIRFRIVQKTRCDGCRQLLSYCRCKNRLR